MLAYSDSQRPCCKQQEKNEPKQHWFPLLPFQQFQVLFNSLFKVLFIFPSRYLFAIGLPPIFSFRWNLPPTLSCNPKQLDSLKACAIVERLRQERESHPLCCLFPKDLTRDAARHCFYRPQFGIARQLYRFTRWALPASVALTEGILVSFFSSG